jgi:hypothetical protein
MEIRVAGDDVHARALPPDLAEGAEGALRCPPDRLPLPLEYCGFPPRRLDRRWIIPRRRYRFS